MIPGSLTLWAARDLTEPKPRLLKKHEISALYGGRRYCDAYPPKSKMKTT